MNTPSEPPRDGAGRMIVSGLLVLLGVAGLLASLCGGMFTLMGLTSGGGGAVILAIALPSLVIGGVVAWACFRAVGRRHRSGPFADEGTPGEADGASTRAGTPRED